MPPDTKRVRDTSPVPDKPRAFRAPDALYEAAGDIADRRDLTKPRGQREGISGFLRLALRAYVSNAEASESDLLKIVEQYG